MGQSFIQVNPDSTGKKVDTAVTTTAAQHRNVTVTGDPSVDAAVGVVLNSSPAGTEYGPVVRNIPSGTQPVSAASLPLPTGASTAAKQPALGTAGTASSDVITIQGITSMTPLKTDSSATTQPVSAASLPLPAGASTSALQTTGNTSLASIDTKNPALGQALAASSVPVTLTALEEGLFGALTETAPATDTASSGMNGRLQRVAQRLTSLIALVPAALTGSGNFKTAIQEAVAPTATSMQTAATANGNGSTLSVAGFASATLNIVSSVAMSGGTTINFEASVDGTTYIPMTGQMVSSTRFKSSTTSDGDYRFNVAGYSVMRARISGYSAGTITVKGYSSVFAGSQKVVLAVLPEVTNTSSAGTAITTNTNTLIVAAPGAGLRLKIYDLALENSSATATFCYWTEGSGGTKKNPVYMTQNKSWARAINGRWSLPSNTALYINTATTGANVEWNVGYEIVAD